jgi:hypothetical protein
MPCQRLQHLRALDHGSQLLPGLRHHGEPRRLEAGAGGVHGADVARDDKQVGIGARRALRLGLLLHGVWWDRGGCW